MRKLSLETRIFIGFSLALACMLLVFGPDVPKDLF
jgi:hypothetical protein